MGFDLVFASMHIAKEHILHNKALAVEPRHDVLCFFFLLFPTTSTDQKDGS